MKVLIVGGGGREHAIAWKLHADDPTIELVAAPGNPGIAAVARCVATRADDVEAQLTLARAEGVDLVVIGPEAPLAAGLTDRLSGAGIPVFGPTAAAARIETSKAFAKSVMQRAGIPTAHASVHTTATTALAALAAAGLPVVVKASGLAAGKGVIVAHTPAAAECAVRDMLDHGAFGDAGREILVEEYMEGEELSMFALCDGTDAILMAAAQDHKRLHDGDTGPNTGGMGAYSPVSTDTPELRARVLDAIVRPALAALRDMGSPFRGLMYVGLMLTADGPRVVEFNARFGDPETQALLPRLASPLAEPLVAIARGGSVAGESLAFRAVASVTTVVAAAGYPDPPRTGDALVVPPPPDDVYVFHSGTSLAPDGSLRSAGGRVLGVTALAPSLAEAAARSRDFAERVGLEAKQLRRDIAWRELDRGATPRARAT